MMRRLWKGSCVKSCSLATIQTAEIIELLTPMSERRSDRSSLSSFSPSRGIFSAPSIGHCFRDESSQRSIGLFNFLCRDAPVRIFFDLMDLRRDSTGTGRLEEPSPIWRTEKEAKLTCQNRRWILSERMFRTHAKKGEWYLNAQLRRRRMISRIEIFVSRSAIDLLMYENRTSVD